MRAFVKTGHGYGEAALRELERPKPGPDEVLLRVAACGVCGSDIHAFRSDAGFEWVKTPVILGHEFTGTVEEVGESVDGVSVGQRSVAVAIQGCGGCESCIRGDTQLCRERVALGLSKDGGMAVYATVSGDHLVAVPEGIEPSLAALAEPLAVAVHAVGRAGISGGENVVVSGPGPIGIFCAMLARLRGGEVLLTGVGRDSETRLPAAEKVGLRVADLSEKSLEAHLEDSFGGGPDLWLESSGSVRALESALESVRPGGSVVAVGIYAERMDFSPTECVRRELSLLFSYSCGSPDYAEALEILASGRLDFDGLVSEYPLENAPEVFEAVAEGRVIKAVLRP